MDQIGINFEVKETECVAKWKKRTDKAIKAAGDHANDPWKTAVYGLILEVARTRETFMTYHVWLRLQAISDKTHDGRAIGHVIKQAQADGVMEQSGKFAPNPNRNGSPAPVYRSLIFKQDRLQTLLEECYERTVQ